MTPEQSKSKSKPNTETTLGELMQFLPNFQKFMLLPKPAALTWKLSLCFSSEIKPAIDSFETTRQQIAEQLGVDTELIKRDGESETAFDTRKLERIKKMREYNEQIKELEDQTIELNLEQIDGAKFAESIDEFNKEKKGDHQIILTTALIIPWLFK